MARRPISAGIWREYRTGEYSRRFKCGSAVAYARVRLGITGWYWSAFTLGRDPVVGRAGSLDDAKEEASAEARAQVGRAGGW
jgi:hypothetical protein